jgi:hypothetical protein
MAGALAVTSHAQVFGGHDAGSLPVADFSRSGGFVDVTGCSLSDIPVNAQVLMRFRGKYTTGSGGNDWQLIDSDTSAVLLSGSFTSNGSYVEISDLFQNLKGATLNAKLQIKSGGGLTVWVEAESFSCHYANYTNSVDDTRKMSITTLKMVGTTESILGASGQVGIVTEIEVNAVPSGGIIWNSNSGNMIYGWDGVLIGVSL